MEREGNHIAAGLVAAVALPLGVFVFGLPLLIALPAVAVLYAGVALALAPRRRGDRIDASKIGRAQADVARELIGEGESTVGKLQAAARQLRSPKHRQVVDGLAESAQTTLDRLAAAPEKLSAVRRFLSYYLPRSAEIAEGLVTLERQAAPDPRRRDGVEATLGRLGQAFAFYADNLDRADLQNLDAELKLIDRALAEDVGTIPLAGKD